MQPWWVPVTPSGPDAPLLLGVGHAGSGVAPFRKLAQALIGWDVRALCLPGRERRLAETPMDDLDEVIRRVSRQTEQLVRGRSYLVVGSCTGAIVAAALVERLEKHQPPVALIVLNCVAPHTRTPRRELDDNVILRHLADEGATPSDILDDQEYGPLLVQAYQADMRLAQRRTIRFDRPTPIIALSGGNDTLDPAQVAAWKKVTTGGVDVYTVEHGGHFLLTEDVSMVAAAIRAAWRSPPRSRRR